MNGERPALRLLHTSDVHLGQYDYHAGRDNTDNLRREHHHATFRALIDVGLRERVDFMVIAGDFFDNARVHEATLRFAAEQIARLGAPVIIVPGNHDHVGAGSVYDRLDLTTLAPNLVLMRSIEGETVHLDRLGVAVWGRSHPEHETSFAPFAGAPARGDAPWHIAVGHGHYVHPESADHPSFHIHEDHLAELHHDYIALGHWDRQLRVSAGARVAAYSGAPDGPVARLGEMGRVLVVDLEAAGSVRLTSHPLTGGAIVQHDDIPLLRRRP
ncbi:MAG: DNA repair exonuclease [Chloroflexi bacterium]|nr:DNA repair exonuclease [Chloroflexota bacterium]